MTLTGERAGIRGALIGATLVTALAVLPAAPAAGRGDAELLGANATTLKREPLLRPAAYGSDPIDKLRYGNPTEGIDLAVAPIATPSGNAELSLPMTIPAGRGGVQPDLTLNYDSSGGSGWVGTGWDLDLGSIEVDTSYGAPRYDDERETETYLLDGDQLAPTAVRVNFVPRVKGRADFTRRVDDRGDLIIRHGDDPTNYWWEVRDKLGNVRWYGGTPDFGGPDGTRDDVDDTCGPDMDKGLDEQAVLRTKPGGPIVRWGLSAMRDVGVNQMRVTYDKVTGKGVGSGAGIDYGKQMYPSEVLYTGRAGDPDPPQPGEPCYEEDTAPEPTDPDDIEDARDHGEDPAWQVRFIRDRPGDARRKDIAIDASAGVPVVTSDLLRRIEVRTGVQKDDESLRDFSILSKAFDLHYVDGAFGKALLSRVDQIGSDGKVFAHNDLDYFDEVSRPGSADYDGFADPTPWNTGDDDVVTGLLNAFGSSALGSSENTAGDASAYIGFNPSAPNKDLSLGGSLSVNGGAGEALIEFVDINGDSLPDKVFRDGRTDVRYRLNTSGATGRTTFGEAHEVVGLSGLSTDWDIGVGGGPEAYVGPFAAQFSTGVSVAVAEEYFTDVNADGLADYVRGGKVLFNHLVDGVPTFDEDSQATKVPIGTRDFDAPHLAKLDEAEAVAVDNSPLQDTVRRWVAPYAGTVDIDAPVTYDPIDEHAYLDDGVRLAIQRGDKELWAGRLFGKGVTATPTGVDGVHVGRGQAIYFRLQTGEQATVDRVSWDPKIHYTGYDDGDEGPGTDVNGRSERTFKASEDFTLAGRPAVKLPAPLEGTVHFEGTLKIARKLTDDVSVVLEKNGQDILRRTVRSGDTLTAGELLKADFPVSAPTDDHADLLGLRIETDSDVDVSAIDFHPQMYYTEAKVGGQPAAVNNPDGTLAYEFPILPYIDLYPESSAASPAAEAQTTYLLGSLVADVVTNGAPAGTRVTFTVKSRDGLVAKKKAVIDDPDNHAVTRVALTPQDIRDGDLDGPYFVELSFPDPAAKFVVDADTRVLEDGVFDRDVAHTRRFAGVQGYFPQAYRGWGYAGYSAPGAAETDPIDEEAFRFRRSDFPSDPPTGWSVPEYPNPAKGRAFPFIPYRLPERAADGTVTGYSDVWRGSKETTYGGATRIRATRRGIDDPTQIQNAQPAATDGAGLSAPRLVGVTGPQFSIAAGAFGFSGTVGGSPSFGVVAYEDVNGDAFPDVLTPGSIEFTGPRGSSYDSDADHGDDALSPIREQTTISIGGGFGGSAVAPKSAADGTTSSGTSGGKKGGKRGAARRTASKALASFDLGAAFDLAKEYTNPAVPIPGTAGALDDVNPPDIEKDLADVNGDGLPDRISTEVGGGVMVELNLGYRFDTPIQWSDGEFQSGESYSAGVEPGLGFEYNNREFAGGISYNEGVSFSRSTWADVNGDGILDEIVKDRGSAIEGEVPKGDIKVRFGSGGGLLEEADYGSWSDGYVDLAGQDLISLGEQASQDRSRALGGGLDFTYPIGPLCLPSPLCYIVVNPGLHASHEVGNTTVDLVDVDGDGALDSVKSLRDSSIEVRRNRVGRTNLLRSIDDSLGGSMRLNYRREGNTEASPDPQWVLSSVAIDDGHRGDGVDTELHTFDYSGAVYDQLERQSLGYDAVTERIRSFKGDGDVFDDPVIRTIERTYDNDTVFDAGLLQRELVRDSGGDKVREEVSTWETADLETGDAVDALAIPRNERLGRTLSPRRTKLEQRIFAADGSVGEETWHDFRYDELGNVVWQHDEGEPENDHDDLTAVTTPSSCTNAQSTGSADDGGTREQGGADLTADAKDLYGFVCGSKLPDGGRISPLFDTDRCATWTSIPARYVVTDGDGNVVRRRDGSRQLCDNSSITRLKEDTGDGTRQAVTELNYDEWGSYDDIAYPANAKGERYKVHYEYDPNTHAQVRTTTDSHGLTATVEFDRVTGRVASRRSPAGVVTRYGYDPQHRLRTVNTSLGADGPRLEYDYRTVAHEPAVITRHADVFADDPSGPDGQIETVAFSDARRRIIQTKHDATITTAAGQTRNVMVVDGAVDRDLFGREVVRYAPTEEPLGTAHVFHAARSGLDPTSTTYDGADRVRSVRLPGGRTTSYEYDYAADPGTGGSQVLRTTIKDPEDRVRRVTTDVRGNVLSREQRGATVRRTTYAYGALGDLATITEPGGGVTTHTYDLLGRRTSTTTPDGGTTRHRFDDASNEVAKSTPRTRAANAEITYAYDQERLTGIDYPDAATADVSYEYGAAGAGTAAGRVVRTVDGARERRVEYDGLGRVSKETALMKVPGYQDDPGAHTYTTTFAYDGLGRLASMTYPDGETLTDDYDTGGLLKRVTGSKKGRTYVYADRLGYDIHGARTFQQNGNGTRTTRGYDILTKRLTEQITTTPAREIQHQKYTYDKVGNVTTLVNDLPEPVTSLKGGPGSQTYRYDEFHRLTGADGVYRLPNAKQREYSYAVAYDQAGNITSKTQLDRLIAPKATPTVVNATTATRTYAYDPERAHRVSASGLRRFAYDGDGNLAGWTPISGSEKRTLVYDTADRLITTTDGPTVRTTYGADDLPAITVGPGGTIAFVNRWYTVTSDNTKRTKKIYAGPDLLLTKKADDKNVEDVQRWVHTDLQGSVNVVTDAKALVTEHSEYFPSGEIWIAEDVSNGTQALSHDDVPYQFAGGYSSDVGGLLQYGRRWYDPRDALFSAPDPLLTEAPDRAVDNPQLLGAYTYAENNPLRFVDPAGTDASPAQQKLLAIFGFGDTDVLERGDQTIKQQLAKKAIGEFEEATDAAGERALFNIEYGDGKIKDISFAPFLNQLGSFSLKNLSSPSKLGAEVRDGFKDAYDKISDGVQKLADAKETGIRAYTRLRAKRAGPL